METYEIRISVDQLNLLIRVLGGSDSAEAEKLSDLLFCSLPGDVLNDFTA